MGGLLTSPPTTTAEYLTMDTTAWAFTSTFSTEQISTEKNPTSKHEYVPYRMHPDGTYYRVMRNPTDFHDGNLELTTGLIPLADDRLPSIFLSTKSPDTVQHDDNDVDNDETESPAEKRQTLIDQLKSKINDFDEKQTRYYIIYGTLITLIAIILFCGLKIFSSNTNEK